MQKEKVIEGEGHKIEIMFNKTELQHQSGYLVAACHMTSNILPYKQFCN